MIMVTLIVSFVIVILKVIGIIMLCDNYCFADSGCDLYHNLV